MGSRTSIKPLTDCGCADRVAVAEGGVTTGNSAFLWAFFERQRNRAKPGRWQVGIVDDDRLEGTGLAVQLRDLLLQLVD